MSTPPITVAETARWVLQSGGVPVPLYPDTKQPIGTGWEKKRPTEADIEVEFGGGRNIGHLNGEPSGGRIDIDLDCGEARRAARFLLPRTELISGRESAPDSHWWYFTDEPPRKAEESFDDPVGGDSAHLLEIRSTGGQTVLPPSRYGADPEKGHPTSERCVWHRFGEPTRITFSELKTSVQTLAAATLLARHWPKDRRNKMACAISGCLLRAGWKTLRIELFIRAICLGACDEEIENRVLTVKFTAGKLEKGGAVTGWPTVAKLLGVHGDRIVTTVRDWLGLGKPPRSEKPAAQEPSTPVAIPPYVPFPTNLLPPVPRAYVEATAAAMNCDPSYSALPVLAAVGAAIGSSHVVSPKKRWKEPPYIWALAIGKSGAIKSPPYRDVEEMAEDINDALEAEYEAALEAHKAALEEWTAKVKEFKDGGDDSGPKPKPPVKRSFVKGDVTIEALIGTLKDNPRGLLIGQDELSAWISSFVKYAGKSGTSDLPRWLQLHHAGSINYTRKTGDLDKREVRVRGVGVSVSGTIQPKILSRVLNEEFRASGFLARLLLAMPPWRKRQWTESEIDEATRSEFASLLEELHRLPPAAWPDGRPCPHLVKLSPGAKLQFVAFYNSNGAALESADEDMSAVMSKLEGYALRFALTGVQLHLQSLSLGQQRVHSFRRCHFVHEIQSID